MLQTNPHRRKKIGINITGQGFGKYQNRADSDQGCVDVEVQLHFLYHRCNNQNETRIINL